MRGRKERSGFSGNAIKVVEFRIGTGRTSSLRVSHVRTGGEVKASHLSQNSDVNRR